MPVIHFVDINQKVECVPGANLRETAQRVGYSVYKGASKLLNCQGHGLCGTCRVGIVEGRSMPRNDTEKKRLGHIPEPWRLACQVQVLDNITVTTDEGRIAECIRAKELADAEVLKAAAAVRAARAAEMKKAQDAAEAKAAATAKKAAPAKKAPAKKPAAKKAAPAKKAAAKKSTATKGQPKK